MEAFLGELLFTAAKYVCLIGVAVLGVFAGKKLKDIKNKKEA